MSTPLTDRINSLTSQANAVTGASDTTLSDAVESLIAGYGGSSLPSNIAIDKYIIAERDRTQVIPHSLGQVPDIIMLIPKNTPAGNGGNNFWMLSGFAMTAGNQLVNNNERSAGTWDYTKSNLSYTATSTIVTITVGVSDVFGNVGKEYYLVTYKFVV